MVPYGFMQHGGPIMMGPNSVLPTPGDPAGPGMPSALPGAPTMGNPPPPANISGSLNSGTDGSLSRLPDRFPIQQANYQAPATTAGLAAQPGYLPPPSDKPAKAHWWSNPDQQP